MDWTPAEKPEQKKGWWNKDALPPTEIRPRLRGETFWDKETKRPYCIRLDGRGYQYREYLYVNYCIACRVEFVSWEKDMRACSPACKQTLRMGKPYYISSNGYWQRDGERNGNRRSFGEHQDIGERALGRELKTGELVHHVNLDKLDNRRSNLLICDKKYHMWLHQEYARKFVELAFKNRLIHVRVKCSYCGSTIGYQAFRGADIEGYLQLEVEPCSECLTSMSINQQITRITR